MNQTDGLHIHILMGPTWLQCKSICPIGMQSGSAHHTYSPRNMDTIYGHRILHKQCKGTLQMPPSLHHSYKTHQNLQNRFFQAQVPHHAEYYSGKCIDKSSRQSCGHHHWTTPKERHNYTSGRMTNGHIQSSSQEGNMQSKNTTDLTRASASTKGVGWSSKSDDQRTSMTGINPHQYPQPRNRRNPKPLSPKNQWAPMISQDKDNNNDYVCSLSAITQQQCQTWTLT